MIFFKILHELYFTRKAKIHEIRKICSKVNPQYV